MLILWTSCVPQQLVSQNRRIPLEPRTQRKAALPVSCMPWVVSPLVNHRTSGAGAHGDLRPELMETYEAWGRRQQQQARVVLFAMSTRGHWAVPARVSMQGPVSMSTSGSSKQRRGGIRRWRTEVLVGDGRRVCCRMETRRLAQVVAGVLTPQLGNVGKCSSRLAEGPRPVAGCTEHLISWQLVRAQDNGPAPG